MKNVKTNLFFALSLALLGGGASAQDAMSAAPHDAMKASAATDGKKDSAMSKGGDHMMASHAMAASAPAKDTGHMMAGHAMAASAASK